MAPDLALHRIAPDHVVVELHEALTAPCPAFELHVVADSKTGRRSRGGKPRTGGGSGL